jgi:hypothetical protein
MIIHARNMLRVLSGIAVVLIAASELLGQAQVTPWGNLAGIRVDGQIMAFETSVRLVEPGWSGYRQTSKNLQSPQYARQGNRQVIATRLDDLGIMEVFEDRSDGSVAVDVKVQADTGIAMAGAYFTIDLPAADYAGGTLQSGASKPVLLDSGIADIARGSWAGVRFESRKRRLDVTWGAPRDVIVRRDLQSGRIRLYAALIAGPAKAGQTAQEIFVLKAGGEIDRQPVRFTLDRLHPGRAFEGIGGNFRLEEPVFDPPIIQYALDNLRVAWGRVELPWDPWDPDENRDPLQEARAGRLDSRVQNAMAMARRLGQRRIPVIVSVWFPPRWAVTGDRWSPAPTVHRHTPQHQQPTISPRQPDEPESLRGNPLNPAKMDRICESLAAYLVFMKEQYGVDAALFSFNESDIGVNVRQTAEEHRLLIKTLGPVLVRKGLATKMLLGDVLGDLEWRGAHQFIQPSMDDPATHKYIGAVAFHSWRISSEQNLRGWAEAASRLGVPLLVTEGGPDSHAGKYPDIFLEPSFQLEEIDQYMRISALCQPGSIIQWQLAADYTVISGGGMYGNNAPLTPTMRFYNLKQLGTTPAGSFAMPVAFDRPDITAAAFGDVANGIYTVHIVNKGAARQATLTGLPADAQEMRIYLTDMQHGMEELQSVPVKEGKAQFMLNAASFITIMSAAPKP